MCLSNWPHRSLRKEASKMKMLYKYWMLLFLSNWSFSASSKKPSLASSTNVDSFTGYFISLCLSLLSCGKDEMNK